MTIKAHFDGRVLVPDQPVTLPKGKELIVHVEEAVPSAASGGMTAGELLKTDFVGLWKDRQDIGDSLEFARQLRERAQRRNR